MVEEAGWLSTIRMRRVLISPKSLLREGLEAVMVLMGVLGQFILRDREEKQGSLLLTTTELLLQVRPRLFLLFLLAC